MVSLFYAHMKSHYPFMLGFIDYIYRFGNARMKQWFTAYLQLNNDIGNSSYRKIVTGKFIILVSFAILSILMVGNFIYGKMAIFYIDLGLFITLSGLAFLPTNQRKYTPHIVLHVMALGILLVAYFNHGEEYTPIWSFLYMFLVMSLYGHQKGLRICIVYLATLLLLLFYFTGSYISMMEFIRFTMVSLFTLFFAYLAEMLIYITLEKLIAVKTQLETLTKTDALTGLYNRRYFNELLPKQISHANRSGELLALVIIDIDHFKAYNDTYGHPAGDLALISLANALKAQMRRMNDAVFRIGGEEFALLYQAKDKESGLKVIEDIREAIENLDKYCELERKITISAGLLLIDSRQSITDDAAYELVDKLLYQAKSSGRNMVVMSA